MNRLGVFAMIVGWAAAIAVAEGTPDDLRRAPGSPANDQCAASKDMTFVCGVYRPEDLVAMPGDRWVIASETSLGETALGNDSLVLINTKTHNIHKIPDIDPSAVARHPFEACPSPPKKLLLHGIALRSHPGKYHRLFAVNHHRESIEIFSVQSNLAVPKVKWLGCVMLPQPIYLNDVAATPHGGFVTTKMGDGDIPSMMTKMNVGEMNGAIYQWRSGMPVATEIPNSQGSGNNGLTVSKTGTIFMSSWGTKSVVRLTPVASGYVRHEVAMGFSPDNLSWARDGSLLVAGQQTDKGPATPCETKRCPIRWAIAALDPTTLRTQIIYESDGIAYSAATTALSVGNDIWVGSYVDEKIAIIKGIYPKKSSRTPVSQNGSTF